MLKKIVSREIAIFIIGILITGFLFPGCVFIGYGDRKEKEEEKKIFGFLEGYNHRIKEAQAYLVNAGFNPGTVNGNMNRKTRAAIKDFQKANNLKITGFVDTKTWAALSSYKAQAMSAKSIKEAQAALRTAGFDPGLIDGRIGPKTKKAIIEFQSANGLTANGQLDSKTLAKLKEHSLAKNRR
jgi:peptidoglycan hydrolase-like protein with peptidoglycan-binding domain